MPTEQLTRDGNVDNQRNLMSQLGMSDSLSSSSSEDIIPMQRRRKRSFTRKRNIRTSLGGRSSIFKTNNFSYGFWTLLKYLAILFVTAVLLIDFIFIFNVFKRLDLLQLNVQELQFTKDNQPKEMHSMHAQLKSLEANNTHLRLELANVLKLVDNLTSEVGELRSSLHTISCSNEAAPALKQLPKDVEDLKKTVAELGSKMNSDDKEVKMTSEELARQKIDLNELKGKLQMLDTNASSMAEEYSKTDGIAKQLQIKLIDVDKRLLVLDGSVDKLVKQQRQFESWRTSTADEVNRMLIKLNVSESPKPSVPSAHVKRVLYDAPVAKLLARKDDDADTGTQATSNDNNANM